LYFVWVNTVTKVVGVFVHVFRAPLQQYLGKGVQFSLD
jgi:hypothetical protein